MVIRLWGLLEKEREREKENVKSVSRGDGKDGGRGALKKERW